MSGKTITVDAYEFRRALARIKPAIPRRGGALPVLMCVRLHAVGGNRLVITGSDLELTITATVAMKGSKANPIVVPFGLVEEMVSSAKARQPEDLTITPQGAEVTLTLGRRTRTLTLFPADEYPRLTDVSSDGHEVDAAMFGEVARFASTDCNRPILAGILIAPSALVGTDSYRLGARLDVDVPGLPDAGLIIPAKAAKEVAKVGGQPLLSWTDRAVRFTWPDATITARTIEGDYPNWRGLTTDPALSTIRFHDRADLLDVLAVLAKSDAAGDYPVRIEQDGRRNKAILRMVIPDVGTDEFRVAASFKGTRGSIAYNPAFLASMLADLSTDDATLTYKNNQRPTRIETDTQVRLLMTVRVA